MDKSYPTEKQLAAKQEVRLYFTDEEMRVIRMMSYYAEFNSIQDWLTNWVVQLVDGLAGAWEEEARTNRHFRRVLGSRVTRSDMMEMLKNYPQWSEQVQREQHKECDPKGERLGTSAEEVGR